MLLPQEPCPKYDEIYNELLNNPAPDTDIYAFNEHNAYLYNYLTENTGEVSTAFWHGLKYGSWLLWEMRGIVSFFQQILGCDQFLPSWAAER